MASLFEWASDIDHNPNCPLHDTYQLIRNILAACILPDGTLNATAGHAVMLYDERNPEFMSGGKAMNAWTETRNGLRDKSILRKCTWQQLIYVLRSDSSLLWLTEALAEKNGF